METDKPAKPHRPKASGPKSKKQQNKNAQKNNPRAFAFNSGIRANRSIQRNLEKGEKKLHLPLVDRTPIESPPVIVAVVGPKGVSFNRLIIDGENFTH
jgi:ribosome biogenesis protein BMS1